jgi:uncharacterized damage-inducible protein DinB
VAERSNAAASKAVVRLVAYRGFESLPHRQESARRRGISARMTTVNLVRQFQFNQMTLTRLLSDVSADESLRQVGPDGKCLNWIVGHIIYARGELLGVLGAEPDWFKSLMAVYGEKGVGTFTIETASPLSDLQSLRDQSLELLSQTLTKIGAALSAPCDELPHVSQGGTVADRVGSYVCHEAYHAGQIGLMRRLLGKPGLF